MGAFIIFDICFEREIDRNKFEEKYKIKKKEILVDENSNFMGVAWDFLREASTNPIYFMGFMGYAEPEVILKECLKEGIKIKFLAWIPINDKRASWEKIRGRW
jgi:hypothetical protein